ncbi:hypothetical protein [Halalkalirubrum salinum]|uniref:hypothetical protein n=1 Tax=Halalkalirubrum salinum TaxID=2563889 RepID=UPI0010FB3BB4|nr:hypothetical protein [Halalkalirubrum salinum]
MGVAYAAVEAANLLAVVVLVGATISMVLVVLPVVRRGIVSTAVVRSIGRRFAGVTAVSGTGVLLTEAYLTSTQHTLSSLVTTMSGRLVLASMLLWVVLVACVTVGTGRFAKAVATGETEAAAARSRRWYEISAIVGAASIALTGLF